jgi:serine/threonine protein kinase
MKITKVLDNKYILKATATSMFAAAKVKAFYSMFLKILSASFYQKETESVVFLAESVHSLKEYLLNRKSLSYQDCIKLIEDLSKQISYLKYLQHGIIGIDMNDILVIDDHTFVFIGEGNLYPLNEEGNINIYSPISKPYFMSPEVLELTKIPAEISYKVSYYSLGVLVVYFLLHRYWFAGNKVPGTAEEEDEILKPIQGTKMYWFLKRCLNKDMSKRELLFI